MRPKIFPPILNSLNRVAHIPFSLYDSLTREPDSRSWGNLRNASSNMDNRGVEGRRYTTLNQDTMRTISLRISMQVAINPGRILFLTLVCMAGKQ